MTIKDITASSLNYPKLSIVHLNGFQFRDDLTP
jgi:hypothetical protein